MSFARHLRHRPGPILLGLGLLCLAIGSYARFIGLGLWPLATDEFYVGESVRFWLDSGLPRFPAGGYYARGLLMQVVLAASVMLFGDTELALRWPLAVVGLLAAAVVFFLTARRLGRKAAVLATSIVLLSSWHVEFSRFSRMYALLLLWFLIFVYAVERGWIGRQQRWRWAAVGLALSAVFVHEAQVIIAGILFLVCTSPVFLRRSRRPWLWLSLSAAVVASGILWSRIPTLPPTADQQVTVATVTFFPLHLPDLIALTIVAGQPLLAAIHAAFLLGAVVLAVRRRLPAAGYLVLLPLLGLQVGLAASLLLALVCWRALPRGLGDARVRGVLLPVAGGAVVLAAMVGWQDGRLAVFSRTIDYPPLYQTVINPWLNVMPLLTTALFAGAGWAAARLLWRGLSPARDLTALVTCSGLLGVAMTRTGSVSTRYSYVFYPLLVLLLMEVCTRLLRGRRPFTLAVPGAAPAMMVFAVFLLSQDFRPAHLANPSSEASNFRTGVASRLRGHWYQREDFRGLASAARGLQAEAGWLILDRRTLPTARYFDRERLRVYLPEHHNLVRLIPGRGPRELWTDAAVIYSLDDLAEFLSGNAPVFYAMHLDDRDRALLEDPSGPLGAWRFHLRHVERSSRVGLFQILPR